MSISSVNTFVPFQECSKTKICLCSSQTPTCWTCECGLLFALVSDVRHQWSCKWTAIQLHVCLFRRLIGSHPALVNAIILVLHSVAGSMPTQSSGSSSRNVSASSYSDMPGGQGRWRCYRNVFVQNCCRQDQQRKTTWHKSLILVGKKRNNFLWQQRKF